MKRIIIKFLIIIFSFNTAFSKIMITEITPSNGSLKDFYADIPDWVELYNSDSTAVDLSGWRLGDKKKFSKACDLDGVVIPPKSYKVIFASDRNVLLNYYVIKNQSTGFQKYKTADEFHFDYVKIAGDFEAEFELADIHTAASEESGCGIMLRRSLTPGSEYAAGIITAQKTYEIATRLLPNTKPLSYSSNYRIIEFPNTKIKMKKKGDSVYYYRFINDLNYDLRTVHYFPYSDTMYLGIASSGCVRNIPAEFVVKSLSINGKPIACDSLVKCDIGTCYLSEQYYEQQKHVSFKISSTESETIRLWNQNEELVASMEVPAFPEMIPADVSIALEQDGKVCFSSPNTPNASNANFFSAITATPKIECLGSQWKNNPFTVKITDIPDGAYVYYTLNESTPGENSSRYTNTPITITDNCVLRAVAIKSGEYKSFEAVKTFFLNDSASLPVISITIDSNDLYSETNGFFNPNMDAYNVQDRHAFFEYFDRNKKNCFQSRAALNLAGDLSRKMSQRPFKLSAKHEFSADDYAYLFFSSDSTPAYHSLSLKNGSQTWGSSMLNDPVTSLLTKGILRNVLCNSWEPVLTYVNGNFYGLAHLQCKLNEHYVANKYAIEEDSINIISNACELKSGSRTPFYQFVDKFKYKDFSDDDNFNDLCKYIDLENFIDYTIAEIFFGNNDWPYKNVSFWQTNELDEKWRLFFYDNDCCLQNPEIYILNIMKNDSSYYSALYRALATNKSFVNNLINRTCDLLNTEWTPEKMNHVIDSAAALISPEIERQRSIYPESCKNWKLTVDTLHNFVTRRGKIFLSHIGQFYQKGHTLTVVFDSSFIGSKVKLNTIEIDSFPWTGTYMQSTPVTMAIVPPADSTFRSWKVGNSVLTDTTISYKLWQDTTIISVLFGSDTSAVGENPSGISIYPNPFSSELNISLPESTVVESITVLDLSGKPLLCLNGSAYSNRNNNIIRITDNLQSLATGTYFLKITPAGQGKPAALYKIIKI